MLSNLCIYAIKKSSDLDRAIEDGGADCFKENKLWIRAKRLLATATKHGQRLAVIFAPAEATKRLYAWALLDDVKLHPATKTTNYKFSHLKLFNPRPSKTSLRKARNSRPIEAGFIRSYAICITPDKLHAVNKS